MSCSGSRQSLPNYGTSAIITDHPRLLPHGACDTVWCESATVARVAPHILGKNGGGSAARVLGGGRQTGAGRGSDGTVVGGAGGRFGFGPVTVVCRGDAIQWIELGERWPAPAIERPRCRQFLPAKCRLEMLHPHADPARRSGLINVPRTDGTYITMAIGEWERRLGTLSLELRALLEGTYVISRSGQPFRPYSMRSHASLDEEFMDALWPTVAKMLWKGSFEYVQRGNPLLRGIISCGAVPKAGPPGKRLITDYRVTNVYQDPWPVRFWPSRSRLAETRFGGRGAAGRLWISCANSGQMGDLGERDKLCTATVWVWARRVCRLVR